MVHKRFNKTMQKLSAKLSKGGPRHLWKRVVQGTASFASPDTHPWSTSI